MVNTTYRRNSTMRAIILTIFCVITVSFSVIAQAQITNINSNDLTPKAYLKVDGSVHWFIEPIDEINYLSATALNIRGVLPGITVLTNKSETETLGFRVNQEGTFIDSVYLVIPDLPGSCGMSELEFRGSYKGLIDPRTGTTEINLTCASGFFPGIKFLFDFNKKTATLIVSKISNCDSCAAAVFSFASTGAQILNTEIPDQFYLGQNYPNPFNPSTSIQYAISSEQFVSLKVYDVLGNEIATLVNEEKPVGNYKIVFNGNNLSSGVYFYRIQTGNFTDTKKFVLMK